MSTLTHMKHIIAIALLGGSCTMAPSLDSVATFGGSGNDEICQMLANVDEVTIVGTVSGPAAIGDAEIGVPRVQGDPRLGNAAFIATHRGGTTRDVAAFEAHAVDGERVGNVFGVVVSHTPDATYFAGTYSGALNVDGTAAANSAGLFVGSRRGNTIDWLRSFPIEVEGVPAETAGMIALTRVAGIVNAGSEIVIAANFFGTLDLGGGALGERGAATLIAIRFADNGEVRSSRVLASQRAVLLASSVVTAGEGDFLVVGVVTGDVDFGTGQLTAGEGSAFALRIDAEGEAQWATLLPGNVQTSCYGLAGASTPILVLGPRVWVATEVSEEAELNGESFIPAGVDVLLSSLDLTTGGIEDFVLHGGDGEERAPSLLAGRDDGLFLIGSFRGPTRLGGNDLLGENGIFFVDADASGAMRSAHTLAQNVSLRSSASMGDGRFWIGGVFSGEAIIGETSILSLGEDDGVVALVAP